MTILMFIGGTFLHTLYAFLYILGIGILAFLIGRIYPRSWIRTDIFPFKSFAFEKNGNIYHKIKIMKWKTILPDMSMIMAKILPGFMPKKRIEETDNISVLIKETCIAEGTHFWVSVFGFGAVFLWKGIGVWILAVLFLLLNIPFIIIQRFNRPRLIAAEKMLKRRNLAQAKGVTENEKAEKVDNAEGADTRQTSKA